MSDKSERAYYWIDERAERLGKWVDNNLARLFIVTVFSGLAIWGFLLEEQTNLSTGERLVRSLGPSLAGIVIAAVTIEALAERRLVQERKAQLIRQMGSKYRDVTEMAVIELRHKGWLEDGSLTGTKLREAALSGAYLMEARLSEADLSGAKLSGARLWQADLSGANLIRANLSDARLWQANLSGANLLRANLSNARLWEANLRGVRYWTIEQLGHVKTLEGAIMPDGVQLKQDPSEGRVQIEGPIFEQWKEQYLAKYGGCDSDTRNGAD